MKKGLLLAFMVMGILMATPVLAADMFEDLGSVWERVLSWGSLEFLLGTSADNKLIGFVRIAMGVIVFSLLYLGLSLIPGMSANKNISITISVVLAIISSVFMPGSVLAMFGETYAAAFAFILIGAPLFGIGALLFATPTPNRVIAFAKFLGVCLLIWLFNNIGKWATELVGAR